MQPAFIVKHPMGYLCICMYISVMSSSCGLCWVCSSFYIPSTLSPPTSLPRSLPSHPLSILLLLFDLPSPQPLLPLSLGFGCGEVSLSLMTVGSLPARPPLCPQLAQLSRGTEGQGSREVSQTDPLRQNNKPQKHYSAVSAAWLGTGFWSSVQLCHRLYLMFTIFTL